MQQVSRVVLCVAVLCAAAFAQKIEKSVEIVPPSGYQALVLENSPELQALLSAAVTDVVSSYPAPGFKPDEVLATLVDVRDPKNLRVAHVSGETPIYPASVVKMF